MTVEVFDIAGKEMASLFKKFKQTDQRKVIFDTSSPGFGSYFYRAKTDKSEGVKYILLMKQH